MTHITRHARKLMWDADVLTGVHPSMSAEQIRVTQARATIPIQKARYLIAEYKQLPPGANRGNLWEHMIVLGGQNPEVKPLIKQAFPNRVFAIWRRKATQA